LARGGALESIVDGVTGVLVPEANADAFAEGLRGVFDRPLDAAVIRQHAERFGRARFARQIQTAVEGLLCSPAGEVRC